MDRQEDDLVDCSGSRLGACRDDEFVNSFNERLVASREVCLDCLMSQLDVFRDDLVNYFQENLVCDVDQSVDCDCRNGDRILCRRDICR